MKNVRTYGKAPFIVAVIHGGPGASGEMAPVARELAYDRGVLEPIQTATSLHGQVEELRRVLEKHADIPVILIGFSWGAWLSFLATARYPGDTDQHGASGLRSDTPTVPASPMRSRRRCGLPLP